MGWLRGFEPPTTGITIQYSNQLSYSHHIRPVSRAAGYFSGDGAGMQARAHCVVAADAGFVAVEGAPGAAFAAVAPAKAFAS